MPQKLYQRLALAAAIFVMAVIVRICLDHISGYHWPFITFFPAVLLAAYFCGVWPAIGALVASGLTGAYWHARATGSEQWADFPGLVFFTLAAGINIVLLARVQGQTQRLKAQDDQLKLINRELKHRIKNIFTITSAICVQTIHSGQSPKEMSEAISGRIFAISAALERASVISNEGGDLEALIDDLVRTIAPRGEQLQVSGPRVTLSAAHTTPFALVLHELATNALKYGAWTAPNGTVIVRWDIDRTGPAPELTFRWLERGGLAASLPVKEGFGSVLIRHGLSGATIDYNLGPGGLDCAIRLPAEEPEAAQA